MVQSIYVYPNLAAQEQDASQMLSDELNQHKDTEGKNFMIKLNKGIK